MRVYEVWSPCAHIRVNAPGCREIPVRSHANHTRGQSGAPDTPGEGRLRLRNNEGFDAALALSAGEEPHLSLATAPFASTVNVHDPQWHAGKVTSDATGGN
jgi:hypothetical protein